MTTALCLNCGDLKFGAFCQCPKCNCGPTDRQQVDILFSDHRFAPPVLEDFGKVIKQLALVEKEPQVRTWAFLTYMRDNYPDILYVQAPPELAERVNTVLCSVSLPRVDTRRTGARNTSRPLSGLSGKPSPSRNVRVRPTAAGPGARRRPRTGGPGTGHAKTPGGGDRTCPNCGQVWPAGENADYCGVCGKEMAPGEAGGQATARDNVNEQLRNLLPNLELGAFKEVGAGQHICQHGSTLVDVRVVQVGDSVAVRSSAPVAVGTRLQPDLLRFLLEKNASIPFGAFGVDSRGTVVFAHTILASSSMDLAELSASVRSVLLTADEFDDRIVERWGGKTFKHAMIEQVLPSEILRRLRRKQRDD